MNEKQLKSERIYSENSSFSSMGPWGFNPDQVSQQRRFRC